MLFYKNVQVQYVYQCFLFPTFDETTMAKTYNYPAYTERNCKQLK